MTNHLEVVPEFHDTIDRPAWWHKEQWLASRPISSYPRKKVEGEFLEWARRREGVITNPPRVAAPSPPIPGPPVPRPYRPKHQASDSRTYIIGAEGSDLVKIGWAREPEKRVSYLQIGSPVPLKLLWVSDGQHERALHQHFKDYRVRGEWFDLSPLGDPVEAVKAAVAEIEAAAPDSPA